MIRRLSSIFLEAMALGFPVLVVDQSQGFHYIPIPNGLDQDLWKQYSYS
jgi:hypothetical protein